jgi:hypothetical protein
MEILSMGRESRAKRKDVLDRPDESVTITGTDSGGTIHQITGRDLVQKMMNGNTRRLVVTDEGDWTPFERVEDFNADMVFVNNRYTVYIREFKWSEVEEDEVVGVHLSFKRNDKEVMNSPDDWRDKMRIKNELAGDECEAVELFPAMSRLTDSANQYHLWCLPAGRKFPCGYLDRIVEDRTTFTAKDKAVVLKGLYKHFKQKGITFDPENNSEHKQMADSLINPMKGAKQRDCPSWMKAGKSTWRIPGGRFLVALRILKNIILSKFR